LTLAREAGNLTKDPFRNRDHIENFDALIEDYKIRSAATRASIKMLGGVAYGAAAGEKLDLFFPKDPAGSYPVHLFIHGGYWRMLSKEDFSFVAETITSAGAIAAIMDYDLMPAVRMDRIVNQVRQAIHWVAANIGTYKGDTTRFSISGHSAGAHLATFGFCEGAGDLRPASALLLSGIYDLKPLQSSFLQPLIGLTDSEVTAFSPVLHRHVPGTRVIAAFGGRETDPFKIQGSGFVEHLERQGISATAHMLRDADHMTAVRDLGTPESEAGKLLIHTIRTPR
jgi:arylformamidase